MVITLPFYIIVDEVDVEVNIERKKVKTMYNKDVRNYAKSKNVYLYQIAELLKVSESTFIKKLRKELDDETKESLFKIIDMIAKERDLNTTKS